jgi:hypothetical protein
VSNVDKDVPTGAEEPIDDEPTDDEQATEAGRDEQPNFTDRHPEHFRNPPGHVREFRVEDPTPPD